MRIELHGHQPIGPEGTCFQATARSWPTIWFLVGQFCSDVISIEQYLWGFGQGALINESQARSIGDRIVRSVSIGLDLNTTSDQSTTVPIEDHYTFDIEHLAEFVVFCRNSGGFRISSP